MRKSKLHLMIFTAAMMGSGVAFGGGSAASAGSDSTAGTSGNQGASTAAPSGKLIGPAPAPKAMGVDADKAIPDREKDAWVKGEGSSGGTADSTAGSSGGSPAGKVIGPAPAPRALGSDPDKAIPDREKDAWVKSEGSEGSEGRTDQGESASSGGTADSEAGSSGNAPAGKLIGPAPAPKAMGTDPDKAIPDRGKDAWVKGEGSAGDSGNASATSSANAPAGTLTGPAPAPRAIGVDPDKAIPDREKDNWVKRNGSAGGTAGSGAGSSK